MNLLATATATQATLRLEATVNRQSALGDPPPTESTLHLSRLTRRSQPTRLLTHECERATDAPRAVASDDKRPSVSAPAGRLLAAKSERIRLPNTSPNFRARALRPRPRRFRTGRCGGRLGGSE